MGSFCANRPDRLQKIVGDLKINGAGITFVPDFFVLADIEARRRTRELQQSVSRTGDISAVYALTKCAATRTHRFLS